MRAHIVDGRAKFRCSLQEFYGQPMLREHIARLGVLVPPTSDVNESAPPAYACVNPLDGVARWIAHCPDCRVSAEYVWIEGPHQMFCANCANASIGGKWRPVVLPKHRAAIERALMARPDPSMRGWVPGETLQAVKADTARVVAEVESM